MSEWNFEVQGSQPEPYIVACKEIERKLIVECNCAAGIYGKLCKHKIEVVQNQITAGTEIGRKLSFNSYDSILRELSNIEMEMATLKKRQTRAKKSLTNMMKGV